MKSAACPSASVASGRNVQNTFGLPSRIGEAGEGRAAAAALGRIGAVEPLIRALQDETVPVPAVIALGELADPRAVEGITATLGDDDYRLLVDGGRTAGATVHVR